MSQKLKIKIVNNEQGAGWTSARQAERYIRRGIARPMGMIRGFHAIEFIQDDHRVISARTKVFSDGAFMATLKMIQGLPVVNPVKLIRGRRSTAPVQEYPAVILRRTPQIDAAGFQDRWPQDLIA